MHFMSTEPKASRPLVKVQQLFSVVLFRMSSQMIVLINYNPFMSVGNHTYRFSRLTIPEENKREHMCGDPGY